MSATTYYNDIDPFCCAVLRKQVKASNLPLGDIDERDITTIQASELLGYQHVHLFAGIGGFPLGFLRAGVSHALRVLTEGFPCQDLSPAGNMAGIHGERSGLWGQSARIIKECGELGKPFDYIVIENSSNLLSGDDEEAAQTQATDAWNLRAEDQWTVDDPTVVALFTAWAGVVFGDLADAGYDATWRVLRAADFGAPHLRARAIIVAYPQGAEREWRWLSWDGRSGDPDRRGVGQANPTGERWGAWRSESEEQQGRLCPAGSGTSSERVMANSSSDRCGIGQDQQECKPRSVGQADARLHGTSWPLAHTSSSGWPKLDTTAIAGDQGHAPWRKIAPGSVKRPVESSTGRRERQHQDTGRANGAQHFTLQPGAGAIEPGLGRDTDGLPHWLDRYRWPAGRGSEQYSWEPARVVTERVPHRNARIKALGNAIVPALAEYVGRCIMAAEMAESEGVA